MGLFVRSRLSFVIGLGLTAFVSTSFADIQANRAPWIGPEVARTATFTAHVPGAEKRGVEYICPAEFRSGKKAMTEAEMQEIFRRQAEYMKPKNEALFAEYQSKLADNQKRMNEVPRMVNRGEITREEAQKRFDALRAEQEVFRQELEAQRKVLQAEADRVIPRPTSLAALIINLQHTPSDPNATIIPFEGNNPAPAFDAELNRVFKSHLASCGGPIGYVVVRHYFRDAARPHVDDQGAEMSLLSFAYTYQGGTLTLQPTPGSKMDSGLSVANAQDVTLAGFRALYERMAQIRGDYRKDYAYASRRKPGIVYKYDAYWQQFPDFEIGRRIFDGDFNPYVNTIDFTFLYAHYGSLFTNRCRAQVKSVTKLYYETREYVGGEVTPDLIFEPKYETGTASFEVDSRFAPRLPEYMRSQAMHMMKVWTDKMKRGERFKWTVQGMREAVGDYAREIQLPPNQLFFDKNTCASAAMQQLGENIFRAASGLPSLQAEGVRIAGADQESDPPVAKDPPTHSAQEPNTTTTSKDASRTNASPQAAPEPGSTPASSTPVQPSEQARPAVPPAASGEPVQPTAPPAATAPAAAGNDSILDAKKRAPAGDSVDKPAQADQPARREPSKPAAGTAPPSTQSPAPASAATGKDAATVAKERAAAIQQVSEAHLKAMNEVSQEFQTKMRSAKTRQERQALQQEYQRVQMERQQELQRKLQELSKR